MDSPVLLLVAGLLGIAIGTVATAAYFWSDRRQHEIPQRPEPVVPEPAAEVLSALSSAYVVLDSHGDVLRASTHAYAVGIVRGTDGEHPRLVHKELVELVARAGRDGRTVDQEFRLPRGAAGTGEAIMNVRIAAIGSTQVLLLADDMTRAVRVEETRRDFVANISHELKTPVGSLSLLAETMEDAADDPEAVRRFAQRMITESHRLSELVRDIIELSRVQAETPLRDAQLVSVDDLVAECADNHQNLAEAARITLNTGGTQGIHVYGSPTLLTTALGNLLANAINYSGSETNVGIGVRKVGGIVEIAVRDQGVGIAQDDIERVFERFFRVDKARSRATGGTGLGLSIVKHIALDHGGEVTAWSAPGAGSTFTLRLPIADDDSEKGAAPLRPGGTFRSDSSTEPP